MRKRVALARTLIYEPETLLMDEPFGALDAQLKLLMLDQLQELTRQRRMTVVFVTHDLGEAITLADRVVVFSARPGRIRVDPQRRPAATARRIPHPLQRGLRPSARSPVGRTERRSDPRHRRMSHSSVIAGTVPTNRARLADFLSTTLGRTLARLALALMILASMAVPTGSRISASG